MQLSLLDAKPAPRRSRPRAKPLTIAERFEAFHVENPHVLAEMLRLARARLDRGETWISVKALWEELRMSLSVMRGPGAYKLDNSLTSLYARALIDAEPKLVSAIEIRRRRAK